MSIQNWTNDQVINQLNLGYKWNSSTITYAFPSSSIGIYSRGESATFRPVNISQKVLFVQALQAWDDLIPQNFQETTQTNSNVEFGYTTSNIGFAHAYPPTNGSAWFSSSYGDLTSPIVGSYGFSTLIHEIGHAVGLNHMGNYNGEGSFSPSSFQDSIVLSIMSYFGTNGINSPQKSPDVMSADWLALNGRIYSPQTPMLNDVMAIQSIYGSSTTTRTGDTIYGFSSNISGSSANIYNFSINQNPILTIFDSGGIDTLNLSGWNTPSIIYLDSGIYSSCNDMTNNIVIAYNCFIENAIGGGGNDILTGNAAGNRLDGGSGNDQLIAGGGDDTLIGGGGNDTIYGDEGSDTAVFTGLFNNFVISYTASNGAYSISGSGAGIDVVYSVEFFKFDDVIKSAEQLRSRDSAPPTLTNSLPLDNAISVSPAANLVLTFDETVQAGLGNFLIYNANGTIARTISVTDTTQVSINGNMVVINPTADLSYGSGYYINMASGVIKDLAGNPYSGISGPNTFNFSTAAYTDITVPTLSNSSPFDNATGIAANANLVFSFSEPVQAGIGNIFIYNANGTIARSIAITDTSQVNISGATVTINPSADLAFGSSYYVNIASGVIKDLAGNSFAGISGSTTYNFTTAVPAVTDDYPWNTNTNGIVMVNGPATSGAIETISDLDLFRVTLSAGTTYVFNLLRTIGGLTDPYLSLYNPSIQLVGSDDDSAGATNSRITYTASTSGTYYLGASDYSTGTGNYTISAAIVDTTVPTLIGLSPVDNAVSIQTNTNLILTFDEAVQAGAGNILIYNANGTIARSIAITDTSQVNISGATVTINPSADLAFGSSYYVNIASGVIKDLAGNSFAGISGSTTYNFTTAVPAVTDDYPWNTTTNGIVMVNGPATSGAINFVDDADLFKINLTAGSLYEFNLIRTVGGLSDPYLVIYDPAIELVAFDDDTGESGNAKISLSAYSSGTYYLGVHDYGAGIGSYTVSARNIGDDFPWDTDTNGVVIVNGPATNGVINAVNDSDLFKVSLLAGTTYTFTLLRTLGGLSNPYLYLYSPAVELVSYDDDSAGSQNSRFTYTATATGIYFLGASDFGNGTGAYTIAGVTAVDTTVPTLSSSSPLDNATGVAASANLVFSFSEQVQAGAGNILIYNANGTIARSIAITDTSQVNISGATVTINPSADLAFGSSYYVNIASGVIKDLAGNSFAGISGSTAHNFSTTTADSIALHGVNDNVLTAAGKTVSGNVLINDRAGDGSLISAFLDSGTRNGSLNFLNNGDFTYTPNIGFSGSDSFIYRAFDNSSSSGNTIVTITVQPSSYEAVKRFMKPDGVYFYTARTEEVEVINNQYTDWIGQGTIFYADESVTPTATTVYRFASLVTTGYFYTASPVERDSVIANYAGLYRYEGPIFSVPTADDVAPVYRFADTRSVGVYFFTQSVAERDNAKGHEYMRDEGIAFNAPSTSTSLIPEALSGTVIRVNEAIDSVAWSESTHPNFMVGPGKGSFHYIGSNYLNDINDWVDITVLTSGKYVFSLGELRSDFDLYLTKDETITPLIDGWRFSPTTESEKIVTLTPGEYQLQIHPIEQSGGGYDLFVGYL